MVDFLSSGPGLLLLGLFFAFYWVPFALAAYLVESWNPERARRSLQRLFHPIRHIPPEHPTTPNAA